MEINKLKVYQTLGRNYALAYEANDDAMPDVNVMGYDLFALFSSDVLVLITNDIGQHYYDGQEIVVPKGKNLHIVGTYQYQTNSEVWKTVPIVKILDK